jgi:hypothetical protein
MLYKTGLKKVVSRDMPYDKKSCSFFLFLWKNSIVKILVTSLQQVLFKLH